MPEIDRQQGAGRRVAFRADAAFARPAIYEALEQRDVDYAIRMPANKTLELAVEDILFRPPGRPSCKPLVRYKSFRYQAKSWTTARRIVAKVEHHRGELFPRVGFIVTNMVLPSRSVVRFYNKRGTAEQWIKEGKQATHWTRLSCHRFRANEQERLGKPRRLWWAASLQKSFGVDPLLDRDGQRMRWTRRVPPALTGPKVPWRRLSPRADPRSSTTQCVRGEPQAGDIAVHLAARARAGRDTTGRADDRCRRATGGPRGSRCITGCRPRRAPPGRIAARATDRR